MFSWKSCRSFHICACCFQPFHFKVASDFYSLTRNKPYSQSIAQHLHLYALKHFGNRLSVRAFKFFSPVLFLLLRLLSPCSSQRSLYCPALFIRPDNTFIFLLFPRSAVHIPRAKLPSLYWMSAKTRQTQTTAADLKSHRNVKNIPPPKKASWK